MLAVLLAVVLAYAGRLSGSPVVGTANRIAALGYAIPGAVIAVGIMVPLGRLDNALADWLDTITTNTLPDLPHTQPGETTHAAKHLTRIYRTTPTTKPFNNPINWTAYTLTTT